MLFGANAYFNNEIALSLTWLLVPGGQDALQQRDPNGYQGSEDLYGGS